LKCRPSTGWPPESVEKANDVHRDDIVSWSVDGVCNHGNQARIIAKLLNKLLTMKFYDYTSRVLAIARQRRKLRHVPIGPTHVKPFLRRSTLYQCKVCGLFGCTLTRVLCAAQVRRRYMCQPQSNTSKKTKANKNNANLHAIDQFQMKLRTQ
jgi:hypothetical protein